jgi:hypothetical protein
MLIEETILAHTLPLGAPSRGVLRNKDERRADALRRELDEFWTKALAAYKQIVEDDGEEPR